MSLFSCMPECMRQAECMCCAELRHALVICSLMAGHPMSSWMTMTSRYFEIVVFNIGALHHDIE